MTVFLLPVAGNHGKRTREPKTVRNRHLLERELADAEVFNAAPGGFAK